MSRSGVEVEQLFTKFTWAMPAARALRCIPIAIGTVLPPASALRDFHCDPYCSWLIHSVGITSNQSLCKKLLVPTISTKWIFFLENPDRFDWLDRQKPNQNKK
jgi:hypothetical protein